MENRGYLSKGLASITALTLFGGLFLPIIKTSESEYRHKAGSVIHNLSKGYVAYSWERDNRSHYRPVDYSDGENLEEMREGDTIINRTLRMDPPVNVGIRRFEEFFNVCLSSGHYLDIPEFPFHRINRYAAIERFEETR